jgi:purine catabolism regulator
VATLLELPELRQGDPVVVTARDQLANVVRWVHVSELADIAGLLSGGELLLTTGIALGDDAHGLRDYVRSLAEIEVSGLILELGRRFTVAPEELVEASEHYKLPLILLRREVPFVKFTEAAHHRIISSQLEELRTGQTIHDTFTDLALQGSTTDEIVRRAALMSACPVLLESVNHHVLAIECGPQPPEALLQAWVTQSRRILVSDRAEVVALDDHWIVTPVRSRGELWGRLAMCVGSANPPQRSIVVLERAAIAIALNRLEERHRESLERHGQRSLLQEILAFTHSPEELEMRSVALGFRVKGRRLVACVIRHQKLGHAEGLDAETLNHEVAHSVTSAAKEAQVHALTGPISTVKTAVILSMPPSATANAALERFATAVQGSLDHQRHGQLIIAAGSCVESLAEIRRSIREAEQVADSISASAPRKPYYALLDVRLKGLLHLLREDLRMQTFYERELGSLLAHDRLHGSDLTLVLRTYLDCGRNKAMTAKALGWSRQTLYDRLTSIATVIGVDIESAESCLSLHVALLGFEAEPALATTPTSVSGR